MAGSMSKWACRARDWFDTACEVCLAVREIVTVIIKIGYGLALIAGLYVILAWTFDNELPYDIEGIKVLTPVVAPGEEFRLALNIHKTRNCQGTVTRTLGGACGNRDILTTPTTLGIGRFDYELHFLVPTDVLDGGICVARVRVTYSCNAWQQLFPVNFFMPEVPFTVRKLTPVTEGSPRGIGPIQ